MNSAPLKTTFKWKNLGKEKSLSKLVNNLLQLGSQVDIAILRSQKAKKVGNQLSKISLHAVALRFP